MNAKNFMRSFGGEPTESPGILASMVPVLALPVIHSGNLTDLDTIQQVLLRIIVDQKMQPLGLAGCGLTNGIGPMLMSTTRTEVK